MRIAVLCLGSCAYLAVLAAPALAADHSVRGRSLVVRQAGTEVSRKVAVVGKEGDTDIGALSDPTVAGAELRVQVSGGTPEEQTFSLPAAGWSPVGNGFRYRPPAGTAAPVASVVMKRRASGVASISVKLGGRVGSQDLEIAPAAPGDSGAVELTVLGGDRYCVGLGGDAGGLETSDTATVWRVVMATTEAPCSPAVCGDGVIEGNELCDGAALGSCGQCGAPDHPFACGCCHSPGTTFFDPYLYRELACCELEGFALSSTTSYCGNCLPDGFASLGGDPPTCWGCCNPICYDHPLSGVTVCGPEP